MTEFIIGREKNLARINWLKKAPEKYIKSLGKYTECTWKVHVKYTESISKVHGCRLNIFERFAVDS